MLFLKKDYLYFFKSYHIVIDVHPPQEIRRVVPIVENRSVEFSTDDLVPIFGVRIDAEEIHMALKNHLNIP